MLQLTNEILADAISTLYYTEYDGDDDVESFIEWLQNGDE